MENEYDQFGMPSIPMPPEMENELKVRQAFREYLGRDPEQEGLDYYMQQLQQNPNYDLASFIGNSVEAQEYNREQIRQNPSSLRDVVENLPMRMPEGEGVVPLAYTLATGTELTLPEYETAGFTPDQLAAFETARGLQGAYEPYLQGGYASTLQGIGSMGQALGGTRELAGQIPGAIQPGQEALSSAAQNLQSAALSGATSAEEAARMVQEAAASSDPATRLAAEELMASSSALGGIFQGVRGAAQGIADQASIGGRQVESRFSGQLGMAENLAAGAVGRGIAGMETGAGMIADEAAQAQAEMRQAAQAGFGAAERAGLGAIEVAEGVADRTGAISPTLREGLGSAQQASTLAAQAGQEGVLAAGERGRATAADTAGRLAEAGAGAQDVAQTAATRARSLGDPLARDLALSTAGARDLSGRGIEGADVAAQRARASTAAAQRALQEASGFGMSSAQQGIAGLRGSTAMYTPDMLDPFMNRFEDAAVQQALADIARQGELREQDIRANAVQAGAFGGSRQAVAEQELGRNILDQMGRTSAQMRREGFESAAARSQQAFEDAKKRSQSAAQLTGQLGQFGSSAAASAAEAAGRLGLEAEGLAQTGALRGAELGMSAEQMASANAQAQAQTGLSIEQLAAQTGLSAQELAGQFAGQAGQQLLASEELAGGFAGQAAQIGMNDAQFQAANEQAIAQTGLNIEQLTAQTGLSANELMGQLGISAAQLGSSTAGQAGQMGMAAGQSRAEISQAAANLGMTEAQFRAANAQALSQTGMTVEELAAQTGISANQLIGQLGVSTETARQGAATNMANMYQNQANIGMAGAGRAGALGLEGAGMMMSGASQAGNLGLQGAQLGLSGIQAGLGAQQQAAGLGQGIAGLGAQQLGFGQTAQALGQQDVSMMGQIGQQQQAQTQAELDAQRMNAYQQALMPYQQLAFASDIAIGAPTGITSIMSQPGPSPLSQITGLATAGLGLYNAYAGAGQ